MNTMKTNKWVFLAVALALVGLVLWKSKEKFQPEFLDRTQIAKTIAVEDSSYDQSTNHMNPTPYSMGPVVGTETPFQVNQYRAYVQ
jgi:hypothetical protein